MSASESTTLLRCPACRERLLVQRPSGETVLLQRLVLIKGGRVYATCSQCRKEVEVEAMRYQPTSVVVSEMSEKNSLTSPEQGAIILA